MVYTIQILLLSACYNLHPYRLYLIELLGFWVELFFSGSQLCLVYMLSWHSVTLYVTNLSLISVYFHLLCSALVMDSSACLQMAPSPTKKKTPTKKTDKMLKMDHNLFRSIQHFERYKDWFFFEGNHYSGKVCRLRGLEKHIHSRLFWGQRMG